MTPAQVLAAMAEEATPKLMETALAMFFECAAVVDEETGRVCGRVREKHPQRDCKVWKPRYGATEAIRLIELTADLSRHAGQMDRELGLDKQVAMVPVMGWGLSAEDAKRMGPEELDAWLLKRLGARRVEAIEEKA